MKYNVDLVFREFKYASGQVAIDLSNLDKMRGRVIAAWSHEFAEHHLLKVLAEATGIKSGWTTKITTNRKLPNNDFIVYDFDITSRLYIALRKKYDKD